ncbi:MAG: hypothetical protein KAV40_04370 [Thermoplasmatales archaeon]|nr:hypothetical protein [Thermoplasmatales archaeon]
MKINVLAVEVVLLVLGLVLIPCLYAQMGAGETVGKTAEIAKVKECSLIDRVENNDNNEPDCFGFGIVFGRTYLLKNWCVYLFPLTPIYVDCVMKARSGPFFAFFVLLLPLHQEYNITAVKPGYYCNTETVTLTGEKPYAIIGFNLKEK